MQCRKCGANLRKEETFCTVCGFYNDGEEENTAEENQQVNFTQNDFLNINNEPIKEENLLDDDLDEKEEMQVQAFDMSPQDVQKEKFYDFQYDRFLEAYIGEDYKVVARKIFNIYAFLLNWAYFLYRKLYVIGIIGLIIFAILIKVSFIGAGIYLGVSMILSGFLFNKIYIKVAQNRVIKIKENNSYLDDFSIEQLCQKKGGVNVPIALGIYLGFLLLVFLLFFNVLFPKKDKYFEENSLNKANCLSLLRQVNNTKADFNVSGELVEGICNISATTPKVYNLYITLNKDNKDIVVFIVAEDDYLKLKGNTEYLDFLKERENSLTADDKAFYINTKNIKDQYTTIKNASDTENKLVEKNKATSERLNYVFTKEEIIG